MRFMENNIKEIMALFIAIDNEMSDLIEKSDSLATEGIGKRSWDRYKELEQLERTTAAILFKDNDGDDMYDYVHDSILDDGINFPKGYAGIIVASYYNSIMRYYNTIAHIVSSTNNSYFVSVPTPHKIPIGTKY